VFGDFRSVRGARWVGCAMSSKSAWRRVRFGDQIKLSAVAETLNCGVESAPCLDPAVLLKTMGRCVCPSQLNICEAGILFPKRTLRRFPSLRRPECRGNGATFPPNHCVSATLAGQREIMLASNGFVMEEQNTAAARPIPWPAIGKVSQFSKCSAFGLPGQWRDCLMPSNNAPSLRRDNPGHQAQWVRNFRTIS